MIHKIQTSIFMQLMETYKTVAEPIVSFPVEYFIDEEEIYLYKVISGTTFCTELQISEGLVLINGQSKDLNLFLEDLIKNFEAIQLLEKLNYIEVKLGIM